MKRIKKDSNFEVKVIEKSEILTHLSVTCVETGVTMHTSCGPRNDYNHIIKEMKLNIKHGESL